MGRRTRHYLQVSSRGGKLTPPHNPNKTKCDGRSICGLKRGALYNNDHLLSWCLQSQEVWQVWGGAKHSVCSGSYPPRWRTNVRPLWALNRTAFSYSVQARVQPGVRVAVRNIWSQDPDYHTTASCSPGHPAGQVALHHVGWRQQAALQKLCSS